MHDFFAMGDYAAYVWSAYAVFFVVLIADTLTVLRQRRRTLRELQDKIKRQTARGTTR